MDENFINSAIDMITPVMEGAIITASQYATACGRKTVTAMDVKYGMRYCAQNVTGKRIGTMFPELHTGDDENEEDEDEEASDIEEVDEDEEPFTRYMGDDEDMISINKSYDEWDEWEPYSPLEKMIKSAVNISG